MWDARLFWATRKIARWLSQLRRRGCGDGSKRAIAGRTGLFSGSDCGKGNKGTRMNPATKPPRNWRRDPKSLQALVLAAQGPVSDGRRTASRTLAFALPLRGPDRSRRGSEFERRCKMKNRLIAAVVVIGFSTLAPVGWAQTAQPVGMVHEDHFLTFNVPVALPNGVTLPAGTYLFRVPRGQGVTQIVSEDRSKTYAQLLTMPTVRDKAEGYELVTEKISASAPPVLKAWYCSGNRTGHQFAPVKK